MPSPKNFFGIRRAQDDADRIRKKIESSGIENPSSFEYEAVSRDLDKEEVQREKISLAKQEIIESGIAQRILDIIKKERYNKPEFIFSIDECDFWVEPADNVWIKTPPLSKDKKDWIKQGFRAHEKYFGSYSEQPLTNRQVDVIRKLLAKQKNMLRHMLPAELLAEQGINIDEDYRNY